MKPGKSEGKKTFFYTVEIAGIMNCHAPEDFKPRTVRDKFVQG
jgi:hypothetical protein